MMEPRRRDRLTMWEASFLLFKAGKNTPGQANGPLVFLILYSAIAVFGLGITSLHSPFSASARAFIVLALCSTYATGTMSAFENGRGEALRFLRVTPFPFAPKWLLFLPFAGTGILIALASLIVLPPLAAVTLFGCWCWATAVGHWFAASSFRLWIVGWLLSFVPMGVAAALHQSGGWAASAVVTVALGSVAWLTSPRERIAALPSPGPAVGPRARVRPARHSARRWTALRMFLLADLLTRRGLRALSAILLVIFAVVAFCSPLSYANMNVLMLMMPFAGFLASSNAPPIRDFLATQPITLGQRLRGLVLPWCLLAAVIPTAELLGANTVTTIDGNQILQLAYPRDVVRAACSPGPVEQSARGSTELAVSPALRRLLLGHVSRVVLLQMTIFASAAAWNLANARLRRRRKRRSISMVVFALSFAMVMPFWNRNWVHWAAPFCLVVPVAALGFWLLVREVAGLESDGRVRSRTSRH
jgi:hypothetical protein